MPSSGRGILDRAALVHRWDCPAVAEPAPPEPDVAEVDADAAAAAILRRPYDALRWMMVAVDPGDVIPGVDLARQKRLVCLNGSLENALLSVDLHVAYDSHTCGSMWVSVRNNGKAHSGDAWVFAGDLV
jgi:hypothetical protein